MHRLIHATRVKSQSSVVSDMAEHTRIAIDMCSAGKYVAGQSFLLAAQIARDELDRRHYERTGEDWGQWIRRHEGGGVPK